MNETTETHPSFGMIGISHTQSAGTNLVGSEFKHHHFIDITIRRAEKKRDDSREWWFGREQLIEIRLSEAQYVELMARPNGVPCTLARVNGESMPEPPAPVSEAKKFRADMQADADKCVESLEKAIARLDEYIAAGRMTKTELKEIRHHLYYDALCSVKHGIPFVQQSFDEKIEATIHHAAVEIEATAASMAMRLGINEMKNIGMAGPRLISDGEGEGPL